jgi:cytoskeletal protein CcmA (bactofilin family)
LRASAGFKIQALRQEGTLAYFSQPKAGDKNGLDKAPVNGKRAEATPVAKNLTATVSTFGPGTLITGNVVCEGSAQILGRVIGDVQAVEITIGEGAQVEGNITAHDVGITGTFKGTIRGHNVRLRGTAMIDGEVFSKSLTVEENVQFEGLSRRLDKPIELPTCAQAAAEKTAPPASAVSGSIAETLV